VITKRLIDAALRCLGHDEGKHWDYLGGSFIAGTAAGVDICCFVMKDENVRFFTPEEDDAFLLTDAVKQSRESKFHELGGPRFRHCLVILRGSDETANALHSHEETPPWPDVTTQSDDIAQRIRDAFEWDEGQKPGA
jgi:hypothetical protein